MGSEADERNGLVTLNEQFHLFNTEITGAVDSLSILLRTHNQEIFQMIILQ